MISIRFFVLLPFLFLSIVACTPQGKNFATEACLEKNSNCSSPSTLIDLIGSDGSRSKINVDNSGGDAGSVSIKKIRYGENSTIEFVVSNTKLNPLKDFTFSMTPNDSAFVVVPSSYYNSCTGRWLFYNEKCSIAVKYTPNKIPPEKVNLHFFFKTMTGGDFNFTSSFDPAVLIADFYISGADLNLPSALIFSSSGSAVAMETADIKIENTSSTTGDGLTIAAFGMSAESPCVMLTPTDSACHVGDILQAQSANFCNIKVGFKPKKIGDRQCLFEILSSKGISRAFTFQGEVKVLSTDLKQIDFGILKVSENPVIKRLSLSVGDDSQSTRPSSCNISLSPSDSALDVSSDLVFAEGMIINVKFSPQSYQRAIKSSLIIDCDTRGGKLSIPVSAATTEGIITSDVSDIFFQNIAPGISVSKTITFANNSTSETISNVIKSLQNQIGSAGSWNIGESSCGASLAPMQSCSLSIVMSAPADFSSNTKNSVENSISFGGSNAQLSPIISLSGSFLNLVGSQSKVDFGQVMQNKDWPSAAIVITNLAATSAENCTISANELSNTGFTIDADSSCLGLTDLPAGGSCTLKPRFSAGSTVGFQRSNLKLTCGVGGAISIPLKAEVVESLLVIAASSNNLLWADRLVGIDQNYDFDFLNVNEIDSAHLQLTSTGIHSPWSEYSTTCAAPLAPGSTCKITLRYNPLATPGAEQAGAASGSILAVSNVVGTTSPLFSTSISFAATSKMISASSTILDFGNVVTNETVFAKSTILFSNPSTVDTASGCSISSLTQFTIEANDCGTSLSPLAQCSVLIKLISPASAQSLSEDLNLTCAIGGQATTRLTSNIIQPLAKLAGSNFGNWDVTRGPLIKTFELSNTSSGSLTVEDAIISGSNDFTILSSTCGGTLSLGSSCSYSVQFDPSALGWMTGNISILVKSSSETATFSSPLSGIGSFMNLELSVESLSYDPIRLATSDSQIKTFTIVNNGNRRAELTYSSLASPWSIGSASTCGATLGVGSTCTMEIKATAYSSAAAHSTIFTISEGQGSSIAPHSVILSGATWDHPLISIKDSRLQSSFTGADLAETNITGPIDDSNNIVNLSPSSRSVVFTIKNNHPLSFSLNNMSMSLTSVSGPSHMIITSDNCSGQNLKALESCTVVVNYVPTAVREVESVYQFTASGKDLGVAYTIKSTRVLGNSFKGVDLVDDYLPTSYNFGLISADTSASTDLITLTNIGDITATNLNFIFSGLINRFTLVDNTCTTTLASAEHCSFKFGFNPNGTVVALRNSLSISSNQQTLSSALDLIGASYIDYQGNGSPTGGIFYQEHEISSDESHFFITSKKRTSTSSTLHLEICNKNSVSGNIEMSSCGGNDLSIGSEPYWTGAFAGYKLNPQTTAHKFLIATSNQLGDQVHNKGISTVLICDKAGITTANTLDFLVSCSVIDLKTISGINNSSHDDGAFTAMQILGSKAIFSSQNPNGFSITACDFNDVALPNSALSNCVVHQENLSGGVQAEYTDIAFDGSHIVMAAHSPANALPGLNGIGCSLGPVNQITCGAYSNIDDSYIMDSGGVKMYPGAHPYVVIDSAGIFIASQQGSEMSQGLRLSKCTLSLDLSLSCINKTVSQATGIDGLGLNPSLKIIQRGASRVAWIQSVSFDYYQSPSGAAKQITIHSCDLSNFSAPCSIYFQQTQVSTAPIYAREMDLDVARKILTIPFSTNENRTGTLSLGLWPEL